MKYILAIISLMVICGCSDSVMIMNNKPLIIQKETVFYNGRPLTTYTVRNESDVTGVYNDGTIVLSSSEFGDVGDYIVVSNNCIMAVRE